MTFRFPALALTAVLALPLAAEAATVSFSVLPDSAVMNPLANATTGVVHENITGSVTNEYRSPWQSAGSAIDYNDASAWYTSVQGGGSATYDLGLSSALSFVWGSPDTYNTVEFLLGGMVVDTVILGAGDVILPGSFATNSALATFADIGQGVFDSVRMLSGGNSFEFANLGTAPAPIPVPAAGVLLLTALGGMAALRRRNKKA
ncbi:MAG: VPLPA-CTERM sorting domain-containing protein [Paracoccus sp. (in: a-proteobacteria)]|nr:VPLPA-CTERM sorting domain-containing protein [Paracoccus sp. (in: a-proteobacteria)]